MSPLMTPRAVLPVFLLADRSGSMAEDGKVRVLNRSIQELIRCFADRRGTDIHLSIITFGDGEARVHLPLTPSPEARADEVLAKGNTPLASAFRLVLKQIEDPAVVRATDYRPVLILVTDGHADDEWRRALAELDKSPVGRSAERYAIAIGMDADESMLARFLEPARRRWGVSNFGLLRAGEESRIEKAFLYIGMTVAGASAGDEPAEMAIDLAG